MENVLDKFHNKCGLVFLSDDSRTLVQAARAMLQHCNGSRVIAAEAAITSLGAFDPGLF